MAPNLSGLVFDRTNPEAIAWAKKHAASMITGVEEQTRAAVRGVILYALEHHLPPAESAQLIRSIVGLTEAQTEAVLHLHEVLADPANWGGTVYAGRTAIAIPEAGLSAEILQRRVDQYSERLENYRAGMIARTETLTASNEGQRQLWVQAEKEGLLTEQEQREWIWHGMPDKNGKLCEICAAMQGQLRGIKEPFTLPDGTQVMNPPAHPLCECTQGISERTLADRRRMESRTAGGPGSGWFREKGHVSEGEKEEGGEKGPRQYPEDTYGESSLSPAVSERVGELDSILRSKVKEKPVERAYALDPEGDISWTAVGKPGGKGKAVGQVSGTTEQFERIRGGVFTHSHPYESSFSDQDIVIAGKYDLAEMRAVTPKGTFSIGPPKGGWDSLPSGRLSKAVSEAFGKTFTYTNEAVETVAKDLGLYYKYTPAGEEKASRALGGPGSGWFREKGHVPSGEEKQETAGEKGRGVVLIDEEEEVEEEIRKASEGLLRKLLELLGGKRT